MRSPARLLLAAVAALLLLPAAAFAARPATDQETRAMAAVVTPETCDGLVSTVDDRYGVLLLAYDEEYCEKDGYAMLHRGADGRWRVLELGRVEHDCARDFIHLPPGVAEELTGCAPPADVRLATAEERTAIQRDVLSHVDLACVAGRIALRDERFAWVETCAQGAFLLRRAGSGWERVVDVSQGVACGVGDVPVALLRTIGSCFVPPPVRVSIPCGDSRADDYVLRIRPRRCDQWGASFSMARAIPLRGISWQRWGGAVARGRGGWESVHPAPGERPTPVRVRAWRLSRSCPYRPYYTRMTLSWTSGVNRFRSYAGEWVTTRRRAGSRTITLQPPASC